MDLVTGKLLDNHDYTFRGVMVVVATYIIGNLVKHEADTSEKGNNAAKRSTVSTG